MKKVSWEWGEKYYEEKAKSIRILQADTMRVANISSSTKPMLASKVESTINASNKGKEMVQEMMQTLDDERSDLIKIHEELLI